MHNLLLKRWCPAVLMCIMSLARRGDALQNPTDPLLSLRRGINVTTTAPNPTDSQITWLNQADGARLRCLGFDFIRLLIDPDRLLHTDAEPYLNALDSALATAASAHLTTILALRPNPDSVHKSEVDFVSQSALRLVEHIRHYPTGQVILDIWNEPAAVVGATPWSTLQDSIVGVLRRGDQLRSLVLTPPGGSLDSLLALQPHVHARGLGSLVANIFPPPAWHSVPFPPGHRDP